MAYSVISRKFIFAYQGDSMYGTFRHGDLIHVMPSTHFQIGDVVVFRQVDTPTHAMSIIHRVCGYTCTGDFITQGDNQLQPDVYPVRFEDVLGRAYVVERCGRSKSVHGGWVGRIWAWFIRLKHRLARLYCVPYRWLRNSMGSLFQRLAVPFVSQVTFSTQEGLRIKYFFLGRSVATWQPAQGRFICRKPFDLFIKPPG